MAGYVSGGQKLITDEYPMAFFFYCTNHVLNLLINDLNEVIKVRNASGTTKEIIFFRGSTLRLNKISKIPFQLSDYYSDYSKLHRNTSSN